MGGHGPPAAASRVPITTLQFLQIDTKCRPRVTHSAAAADQDPESGDWKWEISMSGLFLISMSVRSFCLAGIQAAVAVI